MTHQTETHNETVSNDLFTPDMVEQLNSVFERMEEPLVLKLSLDDRPVSQELVAYVEALAALTDKISVSRDGEVPSEERPCVQICDAQGSPTGLAFHGVPGGHEFTSFVLGLYNARGAGQPIDDADREAAAQLAPKKIQVLVSLSCTMCPETVVAAQRIASLNPQVTAEVYDVAHFPALRKRYKAMSVPCIAVNDGEKLAFGRKSLSEMLELVA